ncbi:MAG: TolB family protein [Actinomycetota bacterium]
MPAARRLTTIALASILVAALAGAANAAPRTRLVSKTAAGVVGDTDSEVSALSATGRFVVFQSYATNLPQSSAVVPRIYLVDTATGAIRLVSKTSAGTPATAGAYEASISGNGRFIAFLSAAANLPGGDGTTNRIYVHDRLAGTTRLVSKTSGGVAADGRSGPASISRDGRYVAFASQADNLPLGDGVLYQVYVHDRTTGTTRVIARTASDSPDGNTQSPSISGDGRVVAFESRSTHLPQGDGSAQMYAYDRSTRQTHLVSMNAQGLAADGPSFGAVVSADGRVVTFASQSSNLPGGDGTTYQVYAYVLATRKPQLVSKTTAGNVGTGPSTESDVSGKGRFIVYRSQAANLPSGDGTRVHLYLFDRRTATTRLLSRNSRQQPGNANSFTPAISSDGRYTSFESYATNFPGGGNSKLQVYVRGLLP